MSDLTNSHPLSSEPQKPDIRLPPNERDFFKEEWKDLLRVAFPDALEIDVQGSLSGYSDEGTWPVTIETSFRETSLSQLFVVKIGHKKRIQKEYDNRETVGGGGLYGHPVTPEDKFDHPSADWALMKSTLAGSDRATTLLAHLQTGDGSDIKDILKKIFGTLNSWNPHRNPKSRWYVHFYDRFLCEHLKIEGLDLNGTLNNAIVVDAEKLSEKLDSLYNELKNAGVVELRNFRLDKSEVESKDSSTILTLRTPTVDQYTGTFQHKVKYKLGMGQSLPHNTDPAIPQLFGQHPQTRYEILTRDADAAMNGVRKSRDPRIFQHNRLRFPNPVEQLENLLYRSAKLKFGLNHGDLNLRNILFTTSIEDENSGEARIDSVWLIDFADVNEGPVLLDFQWFEVQVIIWLVAPTYASISIESLVNFFKALHDCNKDLCNAVAEPLRKPYIILRHTRMYAQEYLVSGWTEYYQGLVICLLGVFRFRKLVEKGELNKFAPRVAFLSAATVLCWTEDVLPDDVTSRISELLRSPEFSKPKPSKVPSVAISNPPEVVTEQPFLLSGQASQTATVRIFNDEEFLIDTRANEKGLWEVEIAVNQPGICSIQAEDYETGKRSNVVRITIAMPPTITISEDSLAIGEECQIRGVAQPNEFLNVYVNNVYTKDIQVNQDGRWHAALSFAESKAYSIYVQDTATQQKSETILLSVIEQSQPAPSDYNIMGFLKTNKAWLLSLGVIAVVFGAANFLGLFLPINPPNVLPDKLIVAASIEAWPFSYRDDNIEHNGFDEFQGYEVELVKAMACRWYYPEPHECTDDELKEILEFVGILTSQRKATVQNNDSVHFVIGSVAFRENRCKVELSDGLICTDNSHANEDQYAILVKADSNFNDFCDAQLNSDSNSLITLKNTTAVVTIDTVEKTTDEKIQAVRDFEGICEEISDMEISVVDNLYDKKQPIINAVQSGNGRDIYRSNYYLLYYAIDSSGQRVGIQKNKYKIWAAPASKTDNYRIWLREEWQELKEKIDNTLSEMSREGMLSEICGGEPYCRNPGGPPEPPEPLITIKIGVAISPEDTDRWLSVDQEIGESLGLKHFNEELKSRNIKLEVVSIPASLEDESVVKRFHYLIDEHKVAAIIGPSYSVEAMEVLNDEKIISSGVIIVAPSNTADGIINPGAGWNNVRVSLPVAIYGDAAAEYVYAKNGSTLKQIQIVYRRQFREKEKDDFNESEKDAWARFWSSKGVTVTTTPLDLPNINTDNAVYERAFEYLMSTC